MAGALLAFTVNSVFWLLVLVGALAIGVALLIALVRATRLAMRPQEVKYDHSWWTNIFGGTSTPHPGPAATEQSPPAQNGAATATTDR